MSEALLDCVLARLDGVKRNGSGWIVRCPAHEDRRQSLSVSEGEGGAVLLHCHAGCTPEAVVARLGLTLADLFPPRETSGNGRRLVDTYHYTDELGALLFEVQRMSDKSFPQRRPDGNGGWVWKLEDTRRVLYHLPALLEAVAAGRVVFVVEGEKDAHTLEALGFAATCNPGGAGKWRPEYNDALRGAHVVILPDNDEPGHKHVRQITATLDGVAADAKVVELPGLPPKGDVSDWVAAGGTAEALKTLVKDAPLWEVSAELPQAARGEFALPHNDDPEQGTFEEWDPPLSLDSPGRLPVFPVEVLPASLRDFALDIAESRQVPVDMPGIALLGIVAASTAGRFIAQLPTHQEPLNMFYAPAVDPGTRKSQVIADVIAPLYERERELCESSKAQIDDARAEHDAQESRYRQLKERCGKTEGLVERGGLQAEMAGVLRTMNDPPISPRLLCDDATPERLAGLMAENGGVMAVISAEGGIVGMMSGRYGKGGPNLDVYLKGHAGDQLRVDRAGDGGHTRIIVRPALTMLLMIQPEVLAELADVQGGRGRGLLGRFLYALPECHLGSRAYTDHPIDPTIQRRYHDRIRAMLETTIPEDPRPLRFDREALQEWVRFHDHVEARLGEGEDLRPIADWASKAAGAVARIAGGLHVVEHAGGRPEDEPISATTVRAAVAIGHYFIAHAMAAFNLMSDTPEMKLARRINGRIERWDKPDFSLRDLHQYIRTENPEDLLPGLRILEGRSILRRQPPAPRTGRGRLPSPRYAVNPNLRNHSQNSQNAGISAHEPHSVNSVNVSREIEPEPHLMEADL